MKSPKHIKRSPKAKLVLGIESSCDECAAAVVTDDYQILASSVHSQDEVHSDYGGVVPELASRDHVRNVSEVTSEALAEAGAKPRDLSGVAVTAGPGLMGSLLVGLSFGKAFAYRFGLPMVGVHHLAGHLAAAELARPDLKRPYLGLVVSGGHTALYEVTEKKPPFLLGETRDDAVGEAFDKVAVLLGLPFPGGPSLARLADEGDEQAISFPRPLSNKPGLDFSYSGLKTSVALEVKSYGKEMTRREKADVAASFQAAATDVLVARSVSALKKTKLRQLAVVGGVAANQRLRRSLGEAGNRLGFEVFAPPVSLCTDNAVMIAAAGAASLIAGEDDGLSLSAFSRVPLGLAPWRQDE